MSITGKQTNKWKEGKEEEEEEEGDKEEQKNTLKILGGIGEGRVKNK